MLLIAAVSSSYTDFQ